MLCVNKYTKEYIDGCHSKMASQLDAYEKLQIVNEDFETLFLNNLVLVLDHFFMHRTRGLEGKDGNPLNEVRMLSNSILENGATMTADKTIKYEPSKAILKIDLGQRIKLSVPQFRRLFEAYFAEIEKKFM